MSELRESFERNGHRMGIEAFYEQGGGVEELFLWCHTCDPEGNGIEGGRVDLRSGEIREAQLQLRKLAMRHSRKP